jgi:hypothetical protein
MGPAAVNGVRSVIDRRLPQENVKNSVVEFRDAWGEVNKRYELGTLNLPQDVAALLGRAFRAHHAGLQPDSRRHRWQALQVFARFAKEDRGLLSLRDLDTATVGRYKAWLDRQITRRGEPLKRSTRANQLSCLHQLVNWIKRNEPDALPARIDFFNNAYPKRASEPRPQLHANALKTILRACYEEIDEAWARFSIGQRILAAEAKDLGDLDPELVRVVRGMAAVGKGAMPAQLAMKANGYSVALLTRHGGLRHIAGHLHLTLEQMAAFFVAITIQTAGNPEPLRRLRRDCQVPHPLDEHRVVIDWSKERAGHVWRRAQRRSFDRRAKYAAPNLIDKVLAMTDPLRAQAHARDRDLLFLTKSEKLRAVTEVSTNTLRHSLKQFIARANVRITIWNEAAPQRRRERLPDFAAAFIRGSVASVHYEHSGGDLLEAQALLNHANAHTTEGYVRGPQAKRLQTETIARLQKLMLAWIDVSSRPAGSEGSAPARERATVPFGHDCLNPLAAGPDAPGDVKGTLCPWFGGCLRCPGLVIPLDAAHLARVLQAKRVFEDARSRLDAKRWALLYAPSYRILAEEILPDFPAVLYGQANAMIPLLPQLPSLE